MSSDARAISSAEPLRPTIPEYEVLRFIGSGAYGEVWLVRKQLEGYYRAAKVIYGDSSKSRNPFKRELAAITEYSDISLKHPNLLKVLHSGINKKDNYLYYVMELADDKVLGQIGLHPETYQAKVLEDYERLPISDCIDIGISLLGALTCLHKAKLVHRDIKPLNIVFNNGQAKLADFGLVTSLSKRKTYAGTEGYIPPEGSGKPQADIYALGKVLYEISTGKDRLDFPDFPTDLSEEHELEQFRLLNRVLLKACAKEPVERYQTAEEMQAALIAVREGRPLTEPTQVTRIKRLLNSIIESRQLWLWLGVFCLIGGLQHGWTGLKLLSEINPIVEDIVNVEKRWHLHNSQVDFSNETSVVLLDASPAVLNGYAELGHLDKYDSKDPAVLTNAFLIAFQDRLNTDRLVSYPSLQKDAYNYIRVRSVVARAHVSEKIVWARIWSGLEIGLAIFGLGLAFGMGKIDGRILMVIAITGGGLAYVALPILPTMVTFVRNAL